MNRKEIAKTAAKAAAIAAYRSVMGKPAEPTVKDVAKIAAAEAYRAVIKEGQAGLQQSNNPGAPGVVNTNLRGGTPPPTGGYGDASPGSLSPNLTGLSGKIQYRFPELYKAMSQRGDLVDRAKLMAEWPKAYRLYSTHPEFNKLLTILNTPAPQGLGFNVPVPPPQPATVTGPAAQRPRVAPAAPAQKPVTQTTMEEDLKNIGL